LEDARGLITQKWSDYQLFKLIFEIVKNKNHLTQDGLNKIISIKSSMNLGLGNELKLAFPDINPIIRPKVSNNLIQDPNWLSGFVSDPFKNIRFYSTDIRHKESGRSLCTNLVLWGTNLSSTTGERYTRSQLAMVQLPLHIRSIMVGLILSDAWITFDSTISKNALIGFKQSVSNSSYLWFVFNLLSHYCSSILLIVYENIKEN
jgi:hypothetical protein